MSYHSLSSQCHSWRDSKWSVDDCSTITLDESAITCHCRSIVGAHIAAFKLSALETYIIEMEQATTPAPESTSTAGGESVTGGTGVDGTSQPILKSTYLEFSFDANYTVVVTKFGTQENARAEICTSTRYDLNLKTDEFKNCTISSGSVVVSFTVVQDDQSTDDTVDLLKTKIAENSFTATVPGEPEPLQTKKHSLLVNGVYVDPPKEAKKGDNLGMIIGAAIGGLILLMMVIALVYCCTKKSKEQKVKSEKLFCCTNLYSMLISVLNFYTYQFSRKYNYAQFCGTPSKK